MVQARQFTSHEISSFFARIATAIGRAIDIHAIHKYRAIIDRNVIARIRIHAINIVLYTAARLRVIVRAKYLVQTFTVQITIFITKHSHRCSGGPHIIWRLTQDLKAQFVSRLFLAHREYLVLHVITSNIGQNSRITATASSKAHRCR